MLPTLQPRRTRDEVWVGLARMSTPGRPPRSRPTAVVDVGLLDSPGGNAGEIRHAGRGDRRKIRVRALLWSTPRHKTNSLLHLPKRPMKQTLTNPERPQLCAYKLPT
jgi:hypothetical protein